MDRYAFILAVLLGLIIMQSCTQAGGAVPPPKPAKPDMLGGAYFLPGWRRVESLYCIAANKDVQHPLLGYYREGDTDAADWHIKWALEHGISFFAFDFYTAGGSQMLETALDDGFLKSKYIGEFKFCLNWCNHAPESTMTAEELDHFGDLVIKKYLTHPSYLRINGKPVVIFLVGHAFIRKLGVEGAKKAFGRFQEKCREAGLPGAYLVFCQDALGPGEVEGARAVGVDAFARYNYPYQGTGINAPTQHAEFSYKHLIDQGEGLWKEWSRITGGNYWPAVMPGWDRRPWTKDLDVIITGSTPVLFAESLAKARSYVSRDKVVMIEAWNEWGEGSVLEPSVEQGFAYLDAVRKVFCRNAGAHKDTDPKSLGISQPVFDLKLPSIDTWKFDHDTDGWTASSLQDVRSEWGALIGTSANTDPQITSPITYLECKRYFRAHIRMRADGAKDNPAQATGQLFWSTVDSMMGEASSVTFPVQLDGKWHNYDLDLSANPKWKGIADRLRFDPVDAAGVKVMVDEIWLERGK